MHDTVRPIHQRAEELVPSCYALRVGDIDLLMTGDGVFPLPATTLATNADPADLAAWLDDRLQRPDVYKWPLNVVVARSGDRTVLIDSGMGAEYPDFPRAGGLPARRGTPAPAAGGRRHRPRVREDVVLTRLHVDHMGGMLADELRNGLRPGVPIHVACAEVAFWSAPDFTRNIFGGT